MRRQLLIVGALSTGAVMFFVLLVIPTFFGASQFLFGGGGGGGSGECADGSKASTQPGEAADARSIPVNYLALYKKAGVDSGIPWNVLAGIGKVETSHGTAELPGVASGENYAGAGGPMQFLEATFKAFAVDGNKDGKKDRYDPADAIPSAAAYLKSNHAPEKMRGAIFRYNHSWDYVDLVLSWAAKYGAGDFKIIDANAALCSDTAGLPANASEVVSRIIDFALAQRGKPYIFGATGPDAWDCSSLVQAAYKAVGITIPRVTFDQWPFGVKIEKGQEQPGDLVFFDTGPNTGPGHPGHVGMAIGGGKMIVARCTLCVPGVGVFRYDTRPDWVGVTRPLARPDVQKQLQG
ncbi:MAG: bifunctional lytic transglycosylase/C40 family peptidase [Streptosporangiaceae bacterium]